MLETVIVSQVTIACFTLSYGRSENCYSSDKQNFGARQSITRSRAVLRSEAVHFEGRFPR